MANLRANKITSTEVFETTGSVQFDGTGDVLTVPNSADFRLGNGDFTIECWFYYKGALSSNRTLFGLFENSSARRSYQVEVRSNGVIRFEWWPDGSTGNSIDTAASTVSISTWHHYAATRTNGIITQYLNGESVASSSAGTSSFYDNTVDPFRIGALNAAVDQSFSGHISNVRVIKGKALYTSNFTPPTRELEVTPETVLLACQSTTKADEEKTGKTITVNGNAVANELTPGLLTDVVKSGGTSAITGSVEFDGSGDYLLLNSGSSDFTLGTDDFTIECWAYPTKYGGIFQFFDSSVLDQTTSGPSIGIDIGENEWKIRYGTNSTGDSNIDVEYNQWYHLAYVRNSSTTTLYVNGINIFAVSDSTNYSANYPVVGGWYDTDYLMKGFISNFRIVKGTALYTSNFIPPTRELKRIPGTVLLCCKNSSDPTAEETGKTITGYGDLVQVGISTNLADSGSYTNGSTGSGVATFTNNVGIITGTDSSNRGILHKTVPVIKGNKYEFSFRSTDASTNGKAGVDSNDGTSDVLDAVTNIPDLVYFSGSTVPNLDTTTGTFRQIFTATTNEAVIYFQEIGPGTLQVTDISLTAIDGKKGSNFTPQVGSDGSVEFAGPTKINSENYFYLPTGNTESRAPVGNYNAGTRGLFAAGNSPGIDNKAIDYITIASTGDAQDFGDLSVNAALQEGGCASHVRGIFTGFITPTRVSNIEYVTISSTSNTNDFGDLTRSDSNPSALSNSTRGVFFGGATIGPTTYKDIIDYVTISSTGNAQDFGDMITASYVGAGAASPTRGILAGGYNGSQINSIEYVTISSTGNAQDFGDLLNTSSAIAGASNAIRAVFAGGETPSVVNTIQYLTISTTGNTFDFGDLPAARRSCGGASSSTRMVIAGGFESPTQTTQMEFVNIATTSNTFDFGDLVYLRMNIGGLSNGHGGLG